MQREEDDDYDERGWMEDLESLGFSLCLRVDSCSPSVAWRGLTRRWVAEEWEDECESSCVTLVEVIEKRRRRIIRIIEKQSPNWAFVVLQGELRKMSHHLSSS